MTEFEFNLSYHLDSADCDHDVIVERFGEAGLTDFVLGVGAAGQIGLMISREGRTAEAVLRSAMADVARILPEAKLIEVGPDFVGLTDVADQVGVSRQNMRKLMLANPETFPLPVHGGSTTIWHGAQVLVWLREQVGYEVPEKLIAIARAAWRVNANAEAARAQDAGFASS